MIELGQEVRDRITKIKGIAIGRTQWLYGCERITIQPQGSKDGKPPESFTVDEPQVEVIGKGVPAVKPIASAKPGGPRPEPQRRTTPSR